MNQDKQTSQNKNPLENQTEKTDNEKAKQQETGNYDTSAIYIRNKETGEWEVRNPAGSVCYNYLYRDEMDF
ncbi:MAG: hypothetical protein JSV88_09450 [Candidatus Aminicenantes bacterium]|nr:MAG: hypothetical protein JSV88_09450 [Candidatus Aminicenantes bacterium]